MRASLLVVIHDEAIVVGRRDLLLVRAFIEDMEVFLGPVRKVRLDRIALRSVGRSAEAIDLAREPRFDLDEDVAKGLAFDEIVGELIEWSIEIIVHLDVTLECADHDFAVAPMVAVEGEPRTRADENAISASGGHERVGDLHGLVEDVVEYLEFRIVDEEEANR